MKTTTTTLALFFSLALNAQTYPITVQNGYSEVAQAAAGDTVHIWAEAWGAARTFSHWSGDTNSLERPHEWHTRIVMPAHAVNFQSNTLLLPTGVASPLFFENLMGRDTLKRVFSYFPPANVMKGVCWLWHGTNGSASSWAGQEYEQFQFVKYLVGHDWGVIVTESEESTKNFDINGDGNLRYDFTGDTSVNIDICNVRAIRDTFIHRGKMNWDTPQASIGFSAGGAFSTLLGSVLDWKAIVSHCAPGLDLVVQNSPTPMQFSMNARDNHPDVGLMGNLDAYNNYQYLLNKEQCTAFFLLRTSPVYRQRFERFPGITPALSSALYDELALNGCIGPAGYLLKSPEEIENEIINNLSNWPVLVGLTGLQRQFVLDQIDVMWSSHHFHTDFMAADLQFIESACGMSVATKTPDGAALTLFPNPAGNWVQLPANTDWVRMYDFSGKIMLDQSMQGAPTLDLSRLPKGMYVVEIMSNGQRNVGKLIKQ